MTSSVIWGIAIVSILATWWIAIFVSWRNKKRHTIKEVGSYESSSRHYIAGWCDISLHDILRCICINDIGIAMVTCIDSNPKTAEMLKSSPELKSIKYDARIVGDNFVVPTKLLLYADSEQRIFFGYDEICFFEHIGEYFVQLTNKSALIIYPNSIYDIRLMVDVSKWMAQNNCVMVVSPMESSVNFVIRKDLFDQLKTAV